MLLLLFDVAPRFLLSNDTDKNIVTLFKRFAFFQKGEYLISDIIWKIDVDIMILVKHSPNYGRYF